MDCDSLIFLIGYRGTGKSTVGRALAARLGYDVVDVDEAIEHRAGKSIAAIFADEGEMAFRDLESQVVIELCRRERTVVALGGGAVLREANREAIVAAGVVVWLTATIDSIAKRLASDGSTRSRRPNLTPDGGRKEIEALLAERTPVYRACATFEISTEEKSAETIANEIVDWLQRANRS